MNNQMIDVKDVINGTHSDQYSIKWTPESFIESVYPNLNSCYMNEKLLVELNTNCSNLSI